MGTDKILFRPVPMPRNGGKDSELLAEMCEKKKISIIISFQIYSLVLQGRVNDVRELLAQHPDKQTGEYDVSAMNTYFIIITLKV